VRRARAPRDQPRTVAPSGSPADRVDFARGASRAATVEGHGRRPGGPGRRAALRAPRPRRPA
jgi:hypothetical protein